jgi:hypothetical protein
MLKNPSFISLIAALSSLALPGLAQAQSSAPSLSGTYRCQPQPSPCTWQGQTLTISQSGPTVELGLRGHARHPIVPTPANLVVTNQIRTNSWRSLFFEVPLRYV